MRFLLVAVLLLSLAATVCAQDDRWQEYYHVLIDENDDDSSAGENSFAALLYETLSAVAAAPKNINAITRDDLEEMLFLTTPQIDAILEYVDRYGALLSTAEMMMIPLLDTPRRNLLAALTTVGEATPRVLTPLDSLRYAERQHHQRAQQKKAPHGEVAAYVKIPFYSRAGDDDGYYGYPYKHWLRVAYIFSTHVRIGAIAAQDAGEPFFANKNKWGYDYYTAFVQVKNVGILKNLVVGHYRVKMGLGLIMNNNISFGRNFGTAEAQSTATVIRPHNSRSENNYLQGAALTIALSRQGDATIFASYRKIDATLRDSTAVRTLLTSGYHRTASELERKHNVAQTVAGANIRYTFLGALHVGLAAVYTHYSLPLEPYSATATNSQLYRRFYPTGQDFWNASITYGYTLGKRLRIEGETGTGDSKMVATVNSVSWRVARRLSLYAVYRYYPVQFTAPLGRSMGNNSSNQNEQGIYVGASWTATERLTIEGYGDYAHYKWPKYLVLGASSAVEVRAQGRYALSATNSLLVRYRYTWRQRNGDDGTLIGLTRHTLRLEHDLTREQWTLRSMVDAVYSAYRSNGAGVLVSETARYKGKWLTGALAVAYFRSKDYYSRLYVYEQGLPYTYSSAAYYGNGIRTYALLQGTLWRLTLTAKIGLTHYFDRDTISSSYQLINSPTQTDLELLLRLPL